MSKYPDEGLHEAINKCLSFKVRLKKIILCLKAAARVCSAVRVWFFFFLIDFNFFVCLIISPVFMNFAVKIYKKDMMDTIKHIGQQTSLSLCSDLF